MMGLIEFGNFLKSKRMLLQKGDASYQINEFAIKIGLSVFDLIKIEKGERVNLSDEKLKILAGELNEDEEVLHILLYDDFSPNLKEIIKKKPVLFLKTIITFLNMAEESELSSDNSGASEDW